MRPRFLESRDQSEVSYYEENGDRQCWECASCYINRVNGDGYCTEWDDYTRPDDYVWQTECLRFNPADKGL